MPNINVSDLEGLIFAKPDEIFDSLYRCRIKQMEVTLKSSKEKSQLIYGWMNRELIERE